MHDARRPTLTRVLAVVALATLAAPRAARADDLRLSLDAEGPGWNRVRSVEDGAKGKAASFDDPDAHVDAGPCPVSSSKPFTLVAHLRTKEPGFSTAVMARGGDDVGISLVMGREPGRVSFEAWSWQSVRLLSKTRVDDGAWHRIEVSYDPRTRTALLLVDARVEAWGDLGEGGAPQALLRLGDNIGAHQPFRGDLDEVEVLRRTTRIDRFAAAAPVLSEEDRRRDLTESRDRALLLPTTANVPKDLAAWTARRDLVRARIADALGLDPLPPKRPLDPEVHGSLEGEGFEVQRISWASWPGYEATGWLWLPRPRAKERRPAVLSPHGHWAGGAIDPMVQTRAIRLAREGYVVLVPDAVHVEHVASGVSAAGVMTWNNLRAIDVLAERDDVDPAKIAVTGASGGGMQTMYLMALSDRLAAAAPICMISRFREILPIDGAHCTCNHAPRVAFVADEPEICATFAPRPAFYGSVTGDWTAGFPKEGLPEIRRVYRLFGRGESIVHVHRNEGHNYGRGFREAVYAFLNDALRGTKGPVDEGDVATIPTERLLALGPPPGVAPDGAALASLFVSRRAPRALESVAPGLPWNVAPSAVSEVGIPDAGASWTRATCLAPDGVRIPMLVRASKGSTRPWIVVVAPEGKASIALDPPAWLERRERVALVDVRWCGEWARFAEAGRRNGLLLGRGGGYQAAHDLALACASLAPQQAVGPAGSPPSSQVTVVGLGSMGVVALLAARLTPAIGTVVAPDVGPRFAVDGNRLPLCPEILRFGDLPRLVSSVRGPEQITKGLSNGGSITYLARGANRIVVGGARGKEDYAASAEVRLEISEAPLSAEELSIAVTRAP